MTPLVFLLWAMGCLIVFLLFVGCIIELRKKYRSVQDLKAQNKLLDEVEEMLHNETPDRHA